MWRLAMSLIAASLALSGPALAGDKPKFEEADKNGDGKVSIQEAKKAGVSEREAKSTDLNEDGKLTRADWQFVDMGTDPGSTASSY